MTLSQDALACCIMFDSLYDKMKGHFQSHPSNIYLFIVTIETLEKGGKCLE